MTLRLFPLFVFIELLRLSEHLFSSQVLPDFFGGIAQLGEHLPCKQGVSGSIPLTSTTQQNAEFRSKVSIESDKGPNRLDRERKQIFIREHSSAG